MSNGAENSARAVVGRPFKKGQSGNPGGRPKGLASQVRKVAPDSELADWYGQVWRGELDPTRPQLEAAAWLTERGHGKAAPLPPVIDDDPLDLKEEETRRAADSFTSDVVRLAAVPNQGETASPVGKNGRGNGRPATS